MKLVRRVRELEPAVRGFGVAWWDMSQATAVCMPIPLNYIAGLVRSVYHVLRAGVRPSAIDQAYNLGWLNRSEYNRQEMRARVMRELADQERREAATAARILREVREELSEIRKDVTH
jgi:hypothetical protein